MRRLAHAAAAAILVAACGKFGSSLPDTWKASVEAGASAWKAREYARSYALCEHAFKLADAAKDSAQALGALDCLFESAVHLKEVPKTAPHLKRYVEAYLDPAGQGNATRRLRNNLGTTLVEAGQREEGLAVLRALHDDWAFADGKPMQAAQYLVVVRNLAIAWSDRASSPEARTFVKLTGGWLEEQLGGDRRGNVMQMLGSARALDALIALGEQQANESTPAWRNLAAALHEKETAAMQHDTLWGQLCHEVALTQIRATTCYRQLP